MPWWFAPFLVLIAGVVLICLSGADLEAWREARWAEQRRPDPGSWLLDRTGCWWCPVDGVGGYVRVPPELQPQRTTLGPKDPPRPVSRSWIVAEIGIAEVMDPREVSVGDGLTPPA